jgi:hypothetical protein
MHLLLPICGKFTRALLAHQIFYFRNLRPKKKLLQFKERITKKYLAEIREPLVLTFGGLANIDPDVFFLEKIHALPGNRTQHLWGRSRLL